MASTITAVDLTTARADHSVNVRFWPLADIPKLSITAVNTGYYTFSYTKDGETKSIPARYSFTYVKDGNDCKIVDHHSSATPSPPR